MPVLQIIQICFPVSGETDPAHRLHVTEAAPRAFDVGLQQMSRFPYWLRSCRRLSTIVDTSQRHRRRAAWRYWIMNRSNRRSLPHKKRDSANDVRIVASFMPREQASRGVRKLKPSVSPASQISRVRCLANSAARSAHTGGRQEHQVDVGERSDVTAPIAAVGHQRDFPRQVLIPRVRNRRPAELQDDLVQQIGQVWRDLDPG